MFRDVGLMRACTALVLVAMLNLIAVGCGLPFKSLPDQPEEPFPITIEMIPTELSQLSPEVELLEISDSHAVFVVHDTSGAPVTVEVHREDLSNNKQRLSVVANGKPISLETLSAQSVLALQDNTGRMKPQIAPAIWVGLTVALFLWECGGALYRHYVQNAKPLRDAVVECVIAGSVAIVGHFAGKVALPVIKNALGQIVTEQALRGISKSSVGKLVDFVARALYGSILRVIKDLFKQAALSYKDPVAPTITRITWPGPIRIGQSGTIVIDFYDPDRDVKQVMAEGQFLWLFWRDMGRWEASNFPNSDSGRVTLSATCLREGRGIARVTISDFGARSDSRQGEIRCVR
jgi:hypothetical protein